jgi:hypothetical protein
VRRSPKIPPRATTTAPRRVGIGPALLCLTAALALGACSSGGDDAGTPIVTGTAPATVPGTRPGSVPPATRTAGSTRPTTPATSRPSRPATTASTTPPPSSLDLPFPQPVPAGVTDCGAWSMSGFPTTMAFNPAIQTCIVEAMGKGTPAMAQVSVFTVLDGEGSAPVRTTIEVIGTDKARIVIDASRAADRPQEVSTLICTSLAPTADAPFVTWDGCRKAGGA